MNIDDKFTKEELESDSFFDWSDESLGRLVRETVAYLKDCGDNGKKAVVGTAACYMLINAARRQNAESLTVTLTGHSVGDVTTGDWEVVVRHKNP